MFNLNRKQLLSTLLLSSSLLINSSWAADPQPNGGPSGPWQLVPELSDEFTGSTLDNAKWSQNVRDWSNSWSWKKDNLTIGNGVLTGKVEYEVHNSHDGSPNDWTVHNEYDGFVGTGGTQPPSRSVTTSYSKSGDASYWMGMNTGEYWSNNTLSQEVLNLPNGNYNISFYASSAGNHTKAEAKITGYGGDDLTKNITSSNAFVEYKFDNVTVTNGKLNIAVTVETDAGNYVRFDDFSVTPVGGNNNHVKNPGFETRDNKYYKNPAMRSLKLIKYGYFEARLKTSLAPGTATAFWLSANGIENNKRYWTELDIVETGQSPGNANRADAARHFLFPAPSVQSGSLGSKTLSDIQNTYHTYAMEWSPTSIKIFYDGVQVDTTYSNTNFHNPMSVIFSIGMRGIYKSNPTPIGFPTTSEVDYIRTWQTASSVSAAVPVDQIIALQSTSGVSNEWLTIDRNDITANGKPNVKSIVGTATPNANQMFKVVSAGNGKVGLEPLGHNGEYVGIERNLTPVNGTLNSTAWSPSQGQLGDANSWNTFEWTDKGNGVIALKSLNGSSGEWLGIDRGATTGSADNAISWVPGQTALEPSNFQTFTWKSVAPIGRIIALHPVAGQTNEWLTIDRIGTTANNLANVEAVVGTAVPTNKQSFKVIDAGNGYVALQSLDGANNEYIGVERNLAPISGIYNGASWSPGAVIGSVNSWNTFEWRYLDSGKVALKPLNGGANEWFGIDRSGTTSLLNGVSGVPATAPNPSDWQTFTWLDLGVAP